MEGDEERKYQTVNFEFADEDYERHMQEFKLLYDRGEVEDAALRFRQARLSSIRRRPRNESFTSFGGGEEEEDGAELVAGSQNEAGETGSSSGRSADLMVNAAASNAEAVAETDDSSAFSS